MHSTHNEGYKCKVCKHTETDAPQRSRAPFSAAQGPDPQRWTLHFGL